MLKKIIFAAIVLISFASCKSKSAFNYSEDFVKKEQPFLQPLFKAVGNKVIDISDTMDLPQFISFINQCDGLVAAGTGPVHIAAALGKVAIGLFPPIKPVHPGRWQPIGKQATYVLGLQNCNNCSIKTTQICNCMLAIEPLQIQAILCAKAAAIRC